MPKTKTPTCPQCSEGKKTVRLKIRKQDKMFIWYHCPKGCGHAIRTSTPWAINALKNPPRKSNTIFSIPTAATHSLSPGRNHSNDTKQLAPAADSSSSTSTTEEKSQDRPQRIAQPRVPLNLPHKNYEEVNRPADIDAIELE